MANQNPTLHQVAADVAAANPFHRPEVINLLLMNREQETVTLDANDLATVLAALRLFQETYEGDHGRTIAERWDHFQLDGGKILAPLGTEDIDRLCETIICADLIKFDASKEELLEDDEEENSGPPEIADSAGRVLRNVAIATKDSARSYHLGLRKRGPCLILEVADSVDQLSCELWIYLGERIRSIAALRKNKAEILKEVNIAHKTDFRRIRVHRIAARDFTAGH